MPEVKLFLFSSAAFYDNKAMPPPADIVKVAIEWPGANAQLIEMDQVGGCVKCDFKHISTLTLETLTSISCQWLKPVGSNLVVKLSCSELLSKARVRLRCVLVMLNK